MAIRLDALGLCVLCSVYGGRVSIGPGHFGRPVNITYSWSKVMALLTGDQGSKSCLHVVFLQLVIVAPRFISKV